MDTVPEPNVPEPARAKLDFARLQSRGIRWQLAPDFAPRLEETLDSHAAIVKESGPKVVARHLACGESYFVKRYRHDAFSLRPLKFFFKPSQARDEWRLSAELERRGIPIVRHVALGERWSGRGLLESILITMGFDGAPVNEARQLDPQLLLQFVRKLAEAGALHTDFHPANLLMNEERGEIRLVDLDGVKMDQSAPPDVLEEEMLSQLLVTMALPVSPRVAELAMKKRKRALAARARRCLKTNRDFAVQKHGTRWWHVRLDSLSPALTSALAAPDRFISLGRMLKDGRSSTVAATKGLALKRFNFRRWLRPFKDFFRESRARQAFRTAYHLELCGISTARPLAAADERCCGLVTRGFIITAEIPSALDVVSWTGDARVLAGRVGNLVGRLHREGFSHRDLKETNILVDPAGMPWLVDLDGVKFRGDVDSETARENLARLRRGVEPSGRLSGSIVMTFMLHYFRARRMSPHELFPRRL